MREHMFVSNLPQPELRRCGRCARQLSLDQFNWRRKEQGQRDNMCRPCRAAYRHDYYEANRAHYIAQARTRKQALTLERTSYLLEYFDRNPCTDCGERDPVVLEFDHIGEKRFNIGAALPYRNWQSILEEIEQCEVVCANCHRRRTAERRGALRVRLSRAIDDAAA